MESRGGDDRLVALAELSFLYPEPGAGVGSNGISPYRRDDKGLGRDIRDSVSGIDYDYDYDT